MKTLLSAFSLFLTLGVYGQYDIEDIKNDSTESRQSINWFEQKQKIYVGGEGNLSFRPGQSFIYFSPLIGYDITQRFSAGIITMYQLLRFRDVNATYNFSTVGGGIFVRYRPIEQIILQTEFDLYNTVDFQNNPLEDRIVVPAFMAGAGFANRLGNRAYYQIMLMYDFIGDPNMPLPWLLIPELHLKMGLVWYLG